MAADDLHIVRSLDDDDNQRAFVRLLTETIAWCAGDGALMRPDTWLRTCKIDRNVDDLDPDHVARVAQERSRRLSLSGRRNLTPVANLCGGRLMAFFPNDSLFDGYAELVSEGFFDWNNTPPHDTWVWMVRGTRVRQHKDGTTGEYERNYLVAWVPPDFIERADLGIVGNPEDCIMWLEKLDDDFARSLRRLKLVA